MIIDHDLPYMRVGWQKVADNRNWILHVFRAPNGSYHAVTNIGQVVGELIETIRPTLGRK